ncbi:hypothetical protein [Bacillus sp. FJAT-45037]|uniref:hypothetical protein n=1 Tax=Bacillus sp. FJAT-45037 TaxID=2011007 RepID=UPI000C232852|nr:hypothetical protein [Bacillus sp. FJAT-45037]
MLITEITLLSIFIVNTALVIMIFLNQKKLSQRIQSIQTSLTEANNLIHNQHHESLMDERRTHILMIAFQIRDGVSKQIDDLHPRLIESLPTDHSLTADEVAQCFTPTEVIALHSFFSLFENYVTKHWLTDQLQYKRIFKGSKAQSNSELAQLHLASIQLVRKLDQLLLTINK